MPSDPPVRGRGAHMTASFTLSLAFHVASQSFCVPTSHSQREGFTSRTTLHMAQSLHTITRSNPEYLNVEGMPCMGLERRAKRLPLRENEWLTATSLVINYQATAGSVQDFQGIGPRSQFCFRCSTLRDVAPKSLRRAWCFSVTSYFGEVAGDLIRTGFFRGYRFRN